MAIVKADDRFNSSGAKGALDGSTAITINSLLYRDTSNGVLKEATSSVGTTLNIEGVSSQAVASGGTEVEFTPIINSPLQIWECDTTSNTAADQLHLAHAMTDATTVANTGSHVATTLAVFVATALVGAASDKKLRGYFLRIGQVTA